jgi:hypothetical protein
MDKRFRYENPLLVDLREDLSCRAVNCSPTGSEASSSCGGGSDITWWSCQGGSCAASNICGTGTKAESCCSGTNACSAEFYGSCQTGTNVSGYQGANFQCACVNTGDQAGMVCAPMGGWALGQGCGTGMTA